MREKLKHSLLKPQYNVCDFYKQQGVFQAIARHSFFEYVTLAVIALNAAWVWVDTDLNSADVLIHAEVPFQVAEHIFCTYFTLEWFVRFMSFCEKRMCLKDGWFIFDSCLVMGMVLETWLMNIVLLCMGGTGGDQLGDASILRVARLLRLSRMARMVRLFRVMPELLILVKGIAAATRSVFFTLCLLVILLYVFGVALRQLMEETQVGAKYFSTVAKSMYTLLISGAFLDSLGSVVTQVGAESPTCAVLFWIFVLLSSLTVMNLLIGVLCEVVSSVSTSERETMMISFVKDRMNSLFVALDTSKDGQISREEFLAILERPEAARLLEEVGVDVLGLVDQVDTIFTEELLPGVTEAVEKQLNFPELMEVILDQRGGNKATVKHIVELRKHMQSAIYEQNKVLVRVEARLDCAPTPTGDFEEREEREDPHHEGREKHNTHALLGKIRPSLLAQALAGKDQPSARPSMSTPSVLPPDIPPLMPVGPSAADQRGPLALLGVTSDLRRMLERLDYISQDIARKIHDEFREELWGDSPPAASGQPPEPLLPGTTEVWQSEGHFRPLSSTRLGVGADSNASAALPVRREKRSATMNSVTSSSNNFSSNRGLPDRAAPGLPDLSELTTLHEPPRMASKTSAFSMLVPAPRRDRRCVTASPAGRPSTMSGVPVSSPSLLSVQGRSPSTRPSLGNSLPALRSELRGELLSLAPVAKAQAEHDLDDVKSLLAQVLAAVQPPRVDTTSGGASNTICLE